MANSLILQGPWRPTATLNALETLATQATDELRIAVAYVTYRGCEELVPRLIDRIGKRRWREIPKTAIVTTDFYMTEPRALEYLQSQGVAVRLSCVPQVNYHPKLYAFTSDSNVDVLVGSANLTVAALNDNVEASSVVRLRASAGSVSLWSELLDAPVELTDELLKSYAAERRSAPPRVRPDREVRAPRAISPARLVPFPDVIAMGVLDPAKLDALWVEAGSPSGGSHNQLELPRGANRFFGFTHSDGGAHVIGYPVLFSGGREWEDRRLTWHGQGKMNQMERLNLPTRRQGGFDYTNMTILFTRVGSQYQLTVARPNSSFARAWRVASREVGHEYRLGKTSPRVCGLF